MKLPSKAAETAANIAIVALAAVVFVLLYQRFMVEPHRHTAARRGGQQPAPQIGRSIDLDLPRLKGPYLLVALSSDCGFCNESIPQLKTIITARGSNEIVYAFPHSDKDASKYLADAGLGFSEDRLWKGDLNDLGVRGTPTLYYVDANGRVKQFWEGRLNPDRAEQIVSITAGTR